MARRIARVQAGISVLVSTVVVAIGLVAVAASDEDRTAASALLLMVMLAGGAMVALTDRWIGRSLDVLVTSGSQLRQSAAERAAELARVNAELQRRDRERADLFSTMSHELRTPLNAIIGHSRVLLDDLDGALNDEQRTDVRQIHDGGQGLLRIVNGTLDFARLEAGGSSVVCAPVQAWTVAEEVVALLRPLAEAQGLRLTSDIGPSLPPVLADEERLRQALVNLVGNALKFTPAGWVHLGAETAGDGVTITVQDSGIGIDEQAHERIFEPFRQSDHGTARAHEGTGLGLAITRRLVTLMGGRVWVESVRGSGSTFSVWLPQPDESHTVLPDWPDDLPAAEPIDVAIVGEGPTTEPLVAALAACGVAARRFSGPNWVRQAAATSPRLLLADVQQPQAAAWQALAQASREPRLAASRLGLVGVASDGGTVIGNAFSLPRLLVVTSEEMSSALPEHLRQLRSSMSLPVLVAGADATWRHQITRLAFGVGLGSHESGYGDAALSVARRVPVSAVVVELTVGSPGIVEFLAELHAALGRRACPVFVVVPAALSPHQQRELHLGALSWIAADASPIMSLARGIAEQLAARTPELVAAGGR